MLPLLRSAVVNVGDESASICASMSWPSFSSLFAMNALPLPESDADADAFALVISFAI
jgi:hypothetical protein